MPKLGGSTLFCAWPYSFNSLGMPPGMPPMPGIPPMPAAPGFVPGGAAPPGVPGFQPAVPSVAQEKMTT